MIRRTEKTAYKDSMYGIIELVYIYFVSNQNKITGEIYFVCDGESCSRENGGKLVFKGKVLNSGTIYIKGDENILIENIYNEKNMEITIQEK